ncbi:putative bifunctional diguanylate cyclase/phosphodiesterase [Altericista sp. CCNU0014]|uniref:putative bifunctional diguanylate cyclase/phosphodiesterase n=1 Tax=Altericista sp. CCNU0014 TaxID=3082949 RepID=UPI00384DE3B7
MNPRDRKRLDFNILDFEEQLQSAQQRLKILEQSAKDSSLASQELQDESITKLSVALEELHVATEEIHAQNAELAIARQSLEIERLRYLELFEFAPDGYLVTTPLGVILEANCAAEKLFNLRREHLLGKPLIVFVSELDRAHFHTQLNQLAVSQVITDWEVSLRTRENNLFPSSISISTMEDLEGKWVGLRWLIRDISDRKQAKQMRYDAFHDSLTGLSNRALLLNRLEHLLEGYQRHPEQLFALLFLDLDRFKPINDSLGHFAGDRVLMEMASRLQTCVRREDTLARLGGDEFVILLEEIHHCSEAEACAVRIQRALAAPFRLKTHEVMIQASIGIVLGHAQYQQPEELLRDADLAMYQAKRHGGACFRIFTSEMQTSKLDAFQLEQELYQAIQRQEFEVYYQPIVSLLTQAPKGFESLVRWHHPQRGILLPSEFLPVAKETGLITLIDEWMMQTACQQMAQWQREFALTPLLTMSVNVSSRLFTQPDFVCKVQAILQKTGLDPRCLTLEITEDVIMSNIEHSAAILKQLRALQVHLTIDDFGTGYSSLSRLQGLAFHGLKIDRCFIGDSDSRELVRAIVLLAHTMGLYVIAEGVETTAQVQTLGEFGCEYAQGYYFGRPAEWPLAQLKLRSNAHESD